MKTKSKAKGFTGICINPTCGKPISWHGNIFGFGYIDIDCKWCGTENRIDITFQSVIKITKVLLVLFLIAVATFFFKKSQARKVTCSSFTTWAAAQKFFDAHPILYSQLDANNDGVACSKLK